MECPVTDGTVHYRIPDRALYLHTVPEDAWPRGTSAMRASRCADKHAMQQSSSLAAAAAAAAGGGGLSATLLLSALSMLLFSVSLSSSLAV